MEKTLATEAEGLQEYELVKRLLIADMSFLTTQEKLFLAASSLDAAGLSALSLSQLSQTIRRTLSGRCQWKGAEALKKALRSQKILSALSIQYTFHSDADFPPLLREMPDPPYSLFYRGSLACLSAPCLSVVGTRRVTAGAKKATENFCREAASAGCTVVSGLAYGVDAAAHGGALQSSSGATAALLASGIDTITPSSHSRLARRILEAGGLVASEYTPGTPAMAFRFIQRDRLIAALSPATVVMQAPSGSGALLTAGFALEYGRDLLIHAAALSEESKLLEQNNQEKLRLQLAQGRNVSYKIENTLEKYVSDGAPVISSFQEYCACRASGPESGFSFQASRQMHLF